LVVLLEGTKHQFQDGDMVFLRDLIVDCTKEPLKVLNVVSKSSFEVILTDFADYKG
jgi:hypothetical protein